MVVAKIRYATHVDVDYQAIAGHRDGTQRIGIALTLGIGSKRGRARDGLKGSGGLRRLEKRLEDLIATVSQIKEENRALRQRQDTLTSERASLLQKNEQVRGRVEAMIGRLKSMEQA